MSLLYLYPEEWTGRRAREVHTLSTCVALARGGRSVTLVTAGGAEPLRAHLREIAGADAAPGLELVALSRNLGPIRSSEIFSFHLRKWLRNRPSFREAFVIHLKAARMLQDEGLPYTFEAHEIFSETPQKNPRRQRALEALEQSALEKADRRVATSRALAEALRLRYGLPDDFVVVPNAGLPPLERSVALADGPFVYCGSIADWKGLDLMIEAARRAGVPLKIIGGSNEEWRQLGARCDVRAIVWKPRVSLEEIPNVLAGARAGLIPTLPESGSGRYSCPMKLFDYARCGLQVLSTALPSLESLDVGSWCSEVEESTVEGWIEALRHFRPDAGEEEAALRWSAGHTWADRVRLLFPEGGQAG
jgi:glycosyltransferase involved in cell wall biosynthesis